MRILDGHVVASAYELLITTDTNLRCQQNLHERPIADRTQAAIAAIASGDCQELLIP